MKCWPRRRQRYVVHCIQVGYLTLSTCYWYRLLGFQNYKIISEWFSMKKTKSPFKNNYFYFQFFVFKPFSLELSCRIWWHLLVLRNRKPSLTFYSVYQHKVGSDLCIFFHFCLLLLFFFWRMTYGYLKPLSVLQLLPTEETKKTKTND